MATNVDKDNKEFAKAVKSADLTYGTAAEDASAQADNAEQLKKGPEIEDIPTGYSAWSEGSAPAQGAAQGLKVTESFGAQIPQDSSNLKTNHYAQRFIQNGDIINEDGSSFIADQQVNAAKALQTSKSVGANIFPDASTYTAVKY